MNQSWSEADTAVFLDRGKYYVPEREIQIQVISSLLGSQPASMRIVELCPGEGWLTQALLERFPEATVLALDGSPAMLDSTRAAAGSHAARLETRAFDLLAEDWRDLDGGNVHAVVSSLAVHHLDGGEKQRLFNDINAALAPDGIFVLADLTEPPSEAGRRVAAETWDLEVKRRAMEIDGNTNIFKAFEEDEWNYYRHVAPGSDPVDKPSSLVEQVTWLGEAGFRHVDVHWMKAGHAIMSGRKV